MPQYQTPSRLPSHPKNVQSCSAAPVLQLRQPRSRPHSPIKDIHRVKEKRTTNRGKTIRRRDRPKFTDPWKSRADVQRLAEVELDLSRLQLGNDTHRNKDDNKTKRPELSPLARTHGILPDFSIAPVSRRHPKANDSADYATTDDSDEDDSDTMDIGKPAFSSSRTITTPSMTSSDNSNSNNSGTTSPKTAWGETIHFNSPVAPSRNTPSSALPPFFPNRPIPPPPAPAPAPAAPAAPVPKKRPLSALPTTATAAVARTRARPFALTPSRPSLSSLAPAGAAVGIKKRPVSNSLPCAPPFDAATFGTRQAVPPVPHRSDVRRRSAIAAEIEGGRRATMTALLAEEAAGLHQRRQQLLGRFGGGGGGGGADGQMFNVRAPSDVEHLDRLRYWSREFEPYLAVRRGKAVGGKGATRKVSRGEGNGVRRDSGDGTMEETEARMQEARYFEPQNGVGLKF